MRVCCIFASKEKNAKQSNSFGMEKLKWGMKISEIDKLKWKMEISEIDKLKWEMKVL